MSILERGHELIVDVKASLIGGEKRTLILRQTHHHIKRLRPGEKLKLNFSGIFKKSGVYEVKVSVIEANVLEVKGEPKFNEEHAITRTPTEIICTGEEWQVRLKKTHKAISWAEKRIRCYSTYELLTIMGSIAAFIAAICSVLTFILTLLG